MIQITKSEKLRARMTRKKKTYRRKRRKWTNKNGRKSSKK